MKKFILKFVLSAILAVFSCSGLKATDPIVVDLSITPCASHYEDVQWSGMQTIFVELTCPECHKSKWLMASYFDRVINQGMVYELQIGKIAQLANPGGNLCECTITQKAMEDSVRIAIWEKADLQDIVFNTSQQQAGCSRVFYFVGSGIDPFAEVNVDLSSMTYGCVQPTFGISNPDGTTKFFVSKLIEPCDNVVTCCLWGYTVTKNSDNVVTTVVSHDPGVTQGGNPTDCIAQTGTKYARSYGCAPSCDNLAMTYTAPPQKHGAEEAKTTNSGTVKVYPSPADEIVNIEYNNGTSGDYTIKIFTIKGVMVGEKRKVSANGNFSEFFNIKYLPTGKYIYRIFKNSGVENTGTFVIER